MTGPAAPRTSRAGSFRILHALLVNVALLLLLLGIFIIVVPALLSISITFSGTGPPCTVARRSIRRGGGDEPDGGGALH